MARWRWVGVATIVAALAAGGAMLRPDIAPADLERRYATPASQFVNVQGMRVHYRDEGPANGPVLLLLHGMASSLQTWDGWVDAMQDSLRIIRLDLPGYGLTGPRPDDDYRMATYMPFLREFLDSLRVPRASIAGNSLGGEIAWNFALTDSSRVDRLILVDPAGFPPGAPPILFRLVRLPVIGGLLEYVGPRWFTALNLQQVYADPSRLTPALIDRYWELMARPGNRRAFLIRSNLIDTDNTARLRQITAPTLILWGDRDLWIPTSLATAFADSIIGARLQIVSNAGHVPMEERPAETSALVKSFVLR